MRPIWIVFVKAWTEKDNLVDIRSALAEKGYEFTIEEVVAWGKFFIKQGVHLEKHKLRTLPKKYS